MRTSLARTLAAVGILAMSTVACSSPTGPSQDDRLPSNVLATLSFAPETLYLQVGHEPGTAKLLGANWEGKPFPLDNAPGYVTFTREGTYQGAKENWNGSHIFALPSQDSLDVTNPEVIPVAPGTGVLHAELNGVKANLVVRVRALLVHPGGECVTPDADPIQLTTEAYDYDGNLLPADAPIEWASQDTTVATVDENGVVSYHGLGSTVITATQHGMTQPFHTTVDPMACVGPSSMKSPKLTR